MNYILVNRFGASYPASPLQRERSHPLVDGRTVQHGISVDVDGGTVEGLQIDTDPHVIGIGADLGPDGVITAVIPRADLSYITLAFARRQLPPLSDRLA